MRDVSYYILKGRVILKFFHKVKYNVNRLYPPDRILVESVNDDDSRALKVELFEDEPLGDENRITLSGQQASASYICIKKPPNGIGQSTKLLLAEDVECQIENNSIIVPIDRAVINNQSGNLKIEITVTDNNEIITLPFPISVTVKPSIVDDSEYCENTQGRVADLLNSVSDTLDEIDADLAKKENLKNKVTPQNSMSVSNLDASYPSLSYMNMMIESAVEDLAEVERGSSILTVCEGYETEAQYIFSDVIRLNYTKLDNILFFSLTIGLRNISASSANPYRIKLAGLPFVADSTFSAVSHSLNTNSIIASGSGNANRSDLTLSVYTSVQGGSNLTINGFYKIKEV